MRRVKNGFSWIQILDVRELPVQRLLPGESPMSTNSEVDSRADDSPPIAVQTDGRAHLRTAAPMSAFPGHRA